MHIEQVGSLRCKVGEGPVWDVTEQALYLVDCYGNEVIRLDPSTLDTRRYALPSAIGSMALRDQGGAVVALSDGLYSLDLENGDTRFLLNPAADQPNTRLNDGKVDRRGRFVVGSVAHDFKSPIAGLHSLDRGCASRLDEGFVLTNGPCWNAEGDRFYLADYGQMAIYVYDYDLESGTVSNRRLFASAEGLGGIPDGATVDRDGRLWSATCASGKIVCYEPDGSIAGTVVMPTKLVTSVMFGGPNLDVLYVTSLDGAAANAADLGIGEDPLGGYLFAVTGLGVTGLPEPRYRD